MIKYDLHCHSTASDGVLTPTELVQRAHEQGVNVLALCDHDTVMGIDEAKFEADKLGVELINGVEISTNWEGRGIHIVGLNFDKTHPKMTALLAEQYNKYVPIAVKIAPDLSEAELVQIADTLLCHQMDGVIATNTTISRDNVAGLKNAKQQGGLSGKPLQHKSTEIIRRLHQELKGQIPIIGSGGIDGVQNAQEKIEAGAELLQVYSGLIYHGPSLVKGLVQAIK